MAEYADAGNNNMENKNVGGRPPTPKASQPYYMSVSTGCSLAGLLSMHVTLGVNSQRCHVWHLTHSRCTKTARCSKYEISSTVQSYRREWSHFSSP